MSSPVRSSVRLTHVLGYFRDMPFHLITGHEPDGRYKLKCRLVINGPRVDLVPVRAKPEVRSRRRKSVVASLKIQNSGF